MSWKYPLTIALCLSISACASKPKKDMSGEEAIKVAQTHIVSGGSAIAIRLTYEGELCRVAIVRLRKVINGKLDEKNSTVLSAGSSNYQVAGLSDKAISQDKFLFNKVTFEKRFAELTNTKISQAFKPIAAGDYLLTSARCNTTRNMTVGMGEDMEDIIVKALFNPKKKPLLGLNFIHIGNGELVDAGILELKHLPETMRSAPSNGAFVMAYPATARFQNALDEKFPEITARIKFTRFDMNLELMSELIKNMAAAE
ncbi:hypothetical protein [Bartonella sp. LJL80]